MEKTKKFDCWNCKHRGSVAGSAHSCCKHPSLKQVKDDPMLGLLAMLGSVQRTPPLRATNEELNIKGNPHGIRSGWFNFPWNFDPTWLENCDGYESKIG